MSDGIALRAFSFGKDLYKKSKNAVLKISEIQAKVKSATNSESWGPSGTALHEIATATNDVEQAATILHTLWERLQEPPPNWRKVYKALVVVDYCVKNGTSRFVEDVRDNLDRVESCRRFKSVEPDSGIDRGQVVREKAKALVELMIDRQRLIEERRKASTSRERLYRDPMGDELELSFRPRPRTVRAVKDLDSIRGEAVEDSEEEPQLVGIVDRRDWDLGGRERIAKDSDEWGKDEESSKISSSRVSINHSAGGRDGPPSWTIGRKSKETSLESEWEATRARLTAKKEAAAARSRTFAIRALDTPTTDHHGSTQKPTALSQAPPPSPLDPSNISSTSESSAKAPAKTADLLDFSEHHSNATPSHVPTENLSYYNRAQFPSNAACSPAWPAQAISTGGWCGPQGLPVQSCIFNTSIMPAYGGANVSNLRGAGGIKAEPDKRTSTWATWDEFGEMAGASGAFVITGAQTRCDAVNSERTEGAGASCAAFSSLVNLDNLNITPKEKQAAASVTRIAPNLRPMKELVRGQSDSALNFGVSNSCQQNLAFQAPPSSWATCGGAGGGGWAPTGQTQHAGTGLVGGGRMPEPTSAQSMASNPFSW